jgi:hypothetical protein
MVLRTAAAFIAICTEDCSGADERRKSWTLSRADYGELPIVARTHFAVKQAKFDEVACELPQCRRQIAMPILPEVFDKRAVDNCQVRFHDVAYIEVTPRFGRAGTPLPAANASGSH